MAAGDPGSPARYYSSTAVETSLQSSIAAQSQGASNTSFIVASTSGFPTSYPYTLIVDPDTSKEEVLTVTAGSGTTLTVTRGADNTQAVAHSAGAVVRHGVSAREFRESENHIAARGYDIDQTILTAANQTHVHGLQTGDGVVVGTDALQTLTRKTLTSPTISNPTFTGTPQAGASIVFEGATADAYETTLTVVDPTADRTLTLPNASGDIAVVQVNKITDFVTPTSALNMGSQKITNLDTPTQSADATNKLYVDSILGSATAAATSAASAAASATAAATSATSAANSATASAASASASATSATAAATSASSAATSATAAATSAASAATSATSAAASATAAATSATSAAASATTAAASVATIAGYATSAANSASAAATSATSAATSATSAANSATAAAASATAAATSATSAAASATAAATSATSAAASATSAAASAAAAATSATSAAASATAAATSETNAAASALAASTSASSASTSASSALTSANSAATSATAAATSAASAATSATSAAASYDQFDDRYLGSKTSDPTVDNDGNPLLTGALYFNTVTNAMKVYTGSAWVNVAPDTSNFIDKSVLSGKGALLGASAASTPFSVTPASTNGYILSIDSATTSGLAWIAPNPGDITSVTAGTGLSGGGTSGDVTLNLANTAVTPGAYTYTSLTVDAQGRLTAASNGTAPVTSVSAGSGISVTGTTTPTVAVDSTVLRTTGGQTITVASGTTVPLTIQNNGTGNSFIINDVASDTTPFVVDADGNVGIGISPNASTKLQAKIATNQVFSLYNGTFVSNAVGIAAVNDAYNAYVPLDILGSSIQLGTAGSERMRIDSSGNVNIGAATPAAGGTNTGGLSIAGQDIQLMIIMGAY